MRLIPQLFLLLLLASCTNEDVLIGVDPDRSRSSAAEDSASGASTGADTSTEESSETTPQPIAQSSGGACGFLRSAAPRGLACLHCTQGQAQTQARQIRQVLLDSCLENVAINFLVDGTFSFDEVFLINEITALTEGGRRLFVTFYLSNGPAQRRYDVTIIDSFGVRISPEEFRNRIQHDPVLQGQYQQIVDRLVPVIRYALQRGAAVNLIPALEDNLSDEAFEKMVELTLDVLPPGINTGIGRNPCMNCYSGNESGRPPGVFEEVHTDWPGISISGGIVSNDGRDYSSSAGGYDPDASTTLAELAQVQAAAGASNNTFILWSAERQGLPSAQGSHPNPASRYYAPISDAERVELVEFLRDGL